MATSSTTNEKIKMASVWLQIVASICAIVAFVWEYQRRDNQTEKS